MATYRIRQGSHRALPFSFGIYWDKKSMSRKIIFNEDCRYDLDGEDQLDWNKLFGLGYLWSLHTDSARFGWRYKKEKDCIEIAAYAYVGGERIMEYIGDIEIGVEAELTLTIQPDFYNFDFSQEGYADFVTIPKTTNKKISYKLGLYFGGNKTAPHEMKVTIDKD